MPDRPATYREIIQHEAEAAGIPPALAFAIVDTESGGRPDAVGPPTRYGQARGLFQLLPQTAQAYQLDATDPVQNIQGGIKLLGELNQRYQGDVAKMLAAYHGGEDPKNHGPLTQNYVETILGKLSSGAAAPAASPRTRGTTFQANPQAAAQAIGVPPPAPLPTLSRLPAVDPTQFEGPSSRWEQVTAAGKAIAEGFNPTTREGRRNIAGAVGGTAGGVLGSPSGPGAAVAAVAGAGVAGALETSIENVIAGDQRNQTANPVLAGGEQAALELGGQAIMWPVKAVGRRLIASKVGVNAARHLADTRDAMLQGFDRAIDAARTHSRGVKLRASRALREATTSAADAVHAARDLGRQGIDAARQAGTAAVEAAGRAVETTQARAAGLVQSAVDAGQTRIGMPPPRTAVGRQTAAVIEGPAQAVLDEYGQAVEAAAQSGPALPLANTRAKAQAIFDREIKDLATYFSGKGEQLDPALAGYLQNALSKGVGAEDKAQFIQALKNAGVDTGLAEATFEKASHPAMGVLRRIVNAPEEVPFLAAHQLKKHLDEAVNWDSPARTLVKQATKAIRTSLREELGVHPEYNTATSRYASTVALFNTTTVKALRRTAREEPGAFLSRLNPAAPESARLLRDLLTRVTKDAGEGAATEGQAAWNAVRAHWTHSKLIKGDVSQLGTRLGKLEAEAPDFVQTLYGDADGQVVLRNLKTIAGAIKAAEEEGRLLSADAVARLEAAKGSKETLVAEARRISREQARVVAVEGRRAVEGVRQAGEAARLGEAERLQALRGERRAAMAPTPEELRFETSTLFPDRKPRALDEHLADFIRAAALGPSTFWGAYSIGRLMRGPASADLIEWAAYSPRTTRALVTLLTSPAAGTGAADLLRLWRGQTAGVTPDVEGPRLGTPPPAPRR